MNFPNMSLIDNLEKMLAAGQDSALLRFGLADAYLKSGAPDMARRHAARALEQDRNYSAAWKVYAKALTELGETEKAVAAYEEGINIAEAKGDKQAVKEMSVFLKRLKKSSQ